MKVADRVTLIALARQDDVPFEKESTGQDARQFLDDYLRELRRTIKTDSEYDLRDSFFVLGRSSLAVLLTCEGLSKVSGLIRLIASIHRTSKQKEGLRIGTFEQYCFPAMEIKFERKSEVRRTESQIIPTLVFIRTSKNLIDLFRRVTKNKRIAGNLYGTYLGFGLYDLILYLRFSTLYELRDKYMELRKSISPFWETSTVIGVPIRKKTKEKAQTRTGEYIPFCTSARCVGGLDDKVAHRIGELAKQKKFRHLFPRFSGKYGSPNLRQGYMDLEVHYCSRTVSDAFDFSCMIRKIDGVVDTCTIVQLPLDGSKNRE